MIIIYTPNTAAPKYIKQVLVDIKGEYNNSGNFNTPLMSMDRYPERNKEMVVSNVMLDQIDLTDISMIIHDSKCYEGKVQAASTFVISKPILDQGFKNGLSE